MKDDGTFDVEVLDFFSYKSDCKGKVRFVGCDFDYPTGVTVDSNNRIISVTFTSKYTYEDKK